jgi:dolichyl-phosphate-mannose--protein O-mannosyl transferase
MFNLTQYVPLIKKWQTWLIVILILSSFSRFYRLGYIRDYVFDEVYHAFTAKMYSLERYEAWVWWESPPEGVAYEWTHPPLAKVIMSWGVDMFGGPGEMPDKAKNPDTLLARSSFGWRFFSAFFGVLGTLALFLFTAKLFNNKWIGLIAATLFTFDLLPLVQSRTAMNDIFAVTFLLFGFYFFIQRTTQGLPYTLQTPILSYKLPLLKWLIAGIFLGCAIASKWTSLFGIGIFMAYHGITLFYHLIQSLYHHKTTLTEKIDEFIHHNNWKYNCVFLLKTILSLVPGQFFSILLFIFILPFVVYLLSYWQLFTLKIDDYKGNSLAEEIQRVNGSLQDYKRQIQDIKNGVCQVNEYQSCNESQIKKDSLAKEKEISFWRTFYAKNPHYADRFYIWWGLQKQMWWYHTNLKATHSYTSQWWTWPLDIRPVWFYVKYCGSTDTNPDKTCKESLQYYHTERTIGDVYTMGNPAIFWLIFPVLGYVFYLTSKNYRNWYYMVIPAIIVMLFQFNLTQTRPSEIQSLWSYTGIAAQNVLPQIILFSMLLGLFLFSAQLLELLFSRNVANEKTEVPVQHFIALFLSLLAFSFLWLPWARSPRIMFFYHFLPPVTFFYPLLAFVLFQVYNKSRNGAFIFVVYILLIATSFTYFYPHVTGALVPDKQRENYFWLMSWK